MFVYSPTSNNSGTWSRWSPSAAPFSLRHPGAQPRSASRREFVHARANLCHHLARLHPLHLHGGALATLIHHFTSHFCFGSGSPMIGLRVVQTASNNQQNASRRCARRRTNCLRVNAHLRDVSVGGFF